MIQIAGMSPGQINMLPLTFFEKNIVVKKANSPVLYRYDSLAALNFELKMRSNIVRAANALLASGADFATFQESRCNEQFWLRTENGGFQLRSDVLSSDGIDDIFRNGRLYAFECAEAVVIILYKAALDTLGREKFNTYFNNLFLMGWNHDSNLLLRRINNSEEAYPGDVLYFENPDYDPRTPEWRGENVIMIADDLYFGHGIGITTSAAIINSLNKARAPGSYTSAYLKDEVIFVDFEELRKLKARGFFVLLDHGNVVVAKVGSTSYIWKKKQASAFRRG
ncbi:protein-glutamine gamma-glutamyltransferase [Paenibacillus sp. 481]|uniref:protein-glutamine gamma-glutamyltransferase n=1 Tax=Paenibacillus sp. 481 TaxID=2835869 RepID=UPI001E5C2CA2|nr:protein-glutamine gamma-glutamyltransferase [Paenibacillus sp. 481]UHA75135.1 protein-glutamine gamma-glutamyltransferase [Paenibacillus sp. 481]